jgi:long-chain acyl-CoA synthetase
VLLSHPAVAEAAVLGVPHSVLGEDIAAAGVLRGGPPAAIHELTGQFAIGDTPSWGRKAQNT